MLHVQGQRMNAARIAQSLQLLQVRLSMLILNHLPGYNVTLV